MRVGESRVKKTPVNQVQSLRQLNGDEPMCRHAFAALCAACALAVVIPGLLTIASAAEREPGPPVVRHVSDVALPVDANTLERQYAALSSMPSVKVAYSALGPVRSVEGATGVVLSTRARNFKTGEDASEVLQKFKDVLLAAGNETLKVSGVQISATGRHRYVTTDQFINGIPVLYGSVSLRFEEGSGLVDSLGANFLPDRGLPRQPKLPSADAAKRVERLLVERGMATAGSVKTSRPTLAYTGTHPDSRRGHLIWAVPASFTPADGGATDGMFWIDALDGSYVGSDALSKRLSVYTDRNTAASPAGFPDNLTRLFDHPGSSSDQLAMNAYNNALDSLQALEVLGAWIHGPLGLVVHYGFDADDATNARHSRKDSVDYLRFGDGYAPSSMGPLGNSRDVVAHELGHGISTVMFRPFRGEPSDAQAGAIDEAFGDVVAALVDTYKRPGVAEATWTIAEIWTNNPTRGLRSMSNPKSMDIGSRDWFPARMLGLDKFTSHNNSTIMSHAFKLMANPLSGGFHVRAGQPILDGGVAGNIPSLFVSGLGPNKTWTLLFETFRSPTLKDFPTLPKVRTAAVAAASLLYGAVDADAVDRAFLAVGVGNNCSAPPAKPQMEAVDRCPRWLLRWPVVPGATVYHAQANPQHWGWLNPTTIIDGNANTCTQRVTTWTQARVRACNGCGCSDWSNEVTMFPWPSCP